MELPQGNGNKLTLKLKINCTEDSQDDIDQMPSDQFKRAMKSDCALSECSPFP